MRESGAETPAGWCSNRVQMGLGWRFLHFRYTLAEALDVNYRSLYEPTLYAAEDIMYTLFELDEHYPSTKLYEVSDPDSSSSHIAVSFNYRLLDEFMREWQQRKKELQAGQITKEEYQEWKLNWPQTSDGCGKFQP